MTTYVLEPVMNRVLSAWHFPSVYTKPVILPPLAATLVIFVSSTSASCAAFFLVNLPTKQQIGRRARVVCQHHNLRQQRLCCRTHTDGTGNDSLLLATPPIGITSPAPESAALLECQNNQNHDRLYQRKSPR